MTQYDVIARTLKRYPALAVIAYVFALAGLLTVTGVSLAAVYERYTAGRSAAELLKQLESRDLVGRGVSSPAHTGPEGSRFLEGRTVTIAGAALLQRVTRAVTRAGGNILSSQVDVSDPQAKQNFVSLTISCEVDRHALGGLLYDIEAGMPFLFVDQLVVQVPQATGRDESGRVRVMLAVSGQWQVAQP